MKMSCTHLKKAWVSRTFHLIESWFTHLIQCSPFLEFYTANLEIFNSESNARMNLQLAVGSPFKKDPRPCLMPLPSPKCPSFHCIGCFMQLKVIWLDY